ncbi:MAG: DUF4040 domain-containing protein [Alphaproteobacteria bacterium]|nr:DUF4040 domain-containing protein [Rickettsiales bacterium]
MNFDYGIVSVCITTMCIVACGIIVAKNLLSATIISGTFSLLAVISYSAMKAPDVAITEVAVGSALSTVFLLLTIGSTGSVKNLSFLSTGSEGFNKRMLSRILKIVATGMLFFSLVNIVGLFPRFGCVNSLANTGVGQFYTSFSGDHFGVHNIVTAILGGYRGFDTLIETTVGFCAAFGVSQIMLTDDANIGTVSKNK